MRKLAVFILAAAMLAGCSAPQSAVTPVAPLPEASASPLPQETGEGYTVKTLDALLPEEGEPFYRLECSVPVFGVEKLDAAVDVYVEELYQRVTEERMPLADGDGEDMPCTGVTFKVQYADRPDGRYTNVLFYETASYGSGAEAEQSFYAIPAGPDGTELNLASASGVYFPEPLAAQQVLNIIAAEPDRYFGDITQDAILSALDFYNGFTIAEEGYTLYVPAGVLADQSAGMLEFSFGGSALYPGFAGDVISPEEYQAILPALKAAAAAFGPDYSGFSNAPTGGQAAAFLREYLLKGNASLTVTLEEYSAAYSAVFGGALSPEDGLGVEVTAGGVVLTRPSVPFFGIRPEDAYLDGDTLTVTGSLMSGLPGGSNCEISAAVTASFSRQGEGFVLTSFEIM